MFRTRITSSLFLLAVIPLLAACSDDGQATSRQAVTEQREASQENRERIFLAAEQVMPLFEGMPAPSFTVKRPGGSEYAFSPDQLESPVVIFFYRGGWCPYCNAQLMELRNVDPELAALGYETLYLNADSPETLQAGLEGPDDTFDYNVLSDNDLVAAKKFGIAFRVDDETVERYLEYNIDLEAASGRDHHALPVPAVFIVNADGRISFAYVNPDYRFRLHPDVLMAAARVALDERDIRERTGQ
jgi:peroxiredoxin